MPLPFAPPLEPMLAEAADEIPEGEGLCYEPKWDGFRVVVFKEGDDIFLSSRNSLPLQRYFPEVVEFLKRELKGSLVLDGELFITGERGLDFDALQSRLHPAASRVKKLSGEIPAHYVAFDLLAVGDVDWRTRPFRERRAELLKQVPLTKELFSTPQTKDRATAQQWFEQFEGAGLDGIIVRKEALPYLPGQRVMTKIKHARTADCVVGGYREGKTPGTVGALLLGLYDAAGVLHHVGHTSSFTAKQKRELKEKLAPYEGGESFGQGRTPGAPSRWTSGKDLSWTPLRPELVCEVKFDYLQGDRFRHGATFTRWRTDKPPADCRYDQLLPPNPFSLDSVVALAKSHGPQSA